MTDSARQSAQAVAALFAERQRFESWLATLEAKRAVTPAHIYTRVHADYTARLQRVSEQLGRHRAAIRDMEGDLTDRLTSLDIDEAKNKDEMAEAELRSNVGELSDEEHREILERTALALERVTGDRMRVTSELTNLRAMLGDDGEIGVLEIGATDVVVTPTPPAMAATPPGKRTSKPGAAATGEKDAWGLAPGDPLAVPPRASVPVPAQDTVPSSPFDDLEFLRSMVDSRGSGDHGAVGNGATSAAAPPEAGEKAPAAKETAPKEPAAKEKAAAAAKRPSKEGVKDAPAVEPAPVAVAAAAPAESSPAIVTTSAAELAAAASKITSPSVSMELETVSKPRGSQETIPSYLRDVPPEQVKTLKCQECGTLNYPTEWYCERCGAELAAL